MTSQGRAAALEAAWREGPGADYVRCRRCDEERIARGGTEDICVPLNGPEAYDCPCGGIREAYDCQGGRFDEPRPAPSPAG